MQKQAPTVGRLLTMVIFALSCFGLLLFLWLAFGGPIPLKPKGYRVEVAIPEANQLAIEADVRSSGVEVGKVRAKRKAGQRQQDDRRDRARPRGRAARRRRARDHALEDDPRREVPRDHARHARRPDDPRGRRGCPTRTVEETVELDEVLGILDPTTRAAVPHLAAGDRARRSRDVAARTSTTRSARCREFAASGTDVLKVLDQQDAHVRRLVRNTGRDVRGDQPQRGAAAQPRRQHRRRVRRDGAPAARRSPTRSRSSRRSSTSRARWPTTSSRSRREARPVVRDLRPAIHDLRPALRDARALAPDLKTLRAATSTRSSRRSKDGLPALRDTLQRADAAARPAAAVPRGAQPDPRVARGPPAARPPTSSPTAAARSSTRCSRTAPTRSAATTSASTASPARSPRCCRRAAATPTTAATRT